MHVPAPGGQDILVDWTTMLHEPFVHEIGYSSPDNRPTSSKPANGLSRAHGKSGPEMVPFTWRATQEGSRL